MYTPNPVDTSSVTIPEDLQDLVEAYAKNTHEVWAKNRMEQGWVYGPKRDDAQKHHPDLLPYEELTDGEKQFDRNTAMETLKLTLTLGYTIQKA